MFALDFRFRCLAGSFAALLTVAWTSIQPPETKAQSSSPPSRPRRSVDPDAYYKAPSTMRGKTVLIPIGTTLEGRIDSTISSEHSHSGQRFNIVLSSPVLLNGVDVVIPSGSKVQGEVMEAVPASQVPRLLGQNKRLIRGKLRIQVSGLETPDGVAYPLVGSLAGEVARGRYGSNRNAKSPVGTGVAYMGSAASFEAVNPNNKTGRSKPGQNPTVTRKREILRDELMGAGDEGFNRDNLAIRSLVLKKRDYWVYEGSPLTVRLTAPFKIGINPPGAGVPLGEVTDGQAEDSLPPPSAQRAGGSPGGAEGNERARQPGVNGGAAIPADSF